MRSPVEVRVLDHAIERDGSEWWCCGLPGWGEAWIAGADVISLTEEAERKPTHWSDRRSIPEIIIELMSDSSAHCVAALVVFIGQKTRKVVVNQYQGDQPLDSWCTDVLMQTPMLEELRFYDGSFDNLQVFIDSAERGWSHLKRLSIRNVFAFTFDKICCLFRTLGDPQHPLTMHLIELDVGFWAMGHGIEEFAHILLEMVEKNCLLQKITFTFQLEPSMHECKSTLGMAFAPTLIEKIPIVTGPVAPRCKLTFLGVLHTMYVSTLPTMDTDVIASIFDFAAPTTTREFSLQFNVLPAMVNEWENDWDGEDEWDDEGEEDEGEDDGEDDDDYRYFDHGWD